VEDLNTGNSTGVKQGTGNLDSRLRRSSAFDSYYQQAKNRPNLDVLHDATVEKLIFSSTGNSGNETKRASAVQFTDHLSGEFFVVEARKEIIVAGGAFASPQMLMVSVSSPSTLFYHALRLTTPGYRTE
jgi:choline dehydrogenase